MNEESSETPTQLGYRWPAEWEPHQGTLLAWPHNKETWPGNFEPIVPLYRQIVDILSTSETVHITAAKGPVFDQAESAVGHSGNVVLHEISTNDAWARDHGGTFLKSTEGHKSAVINWQYNAWGGKYPPWDDDNCVPEKLAAQLGYRQFDQGIVLEGGAIDGNGQGLLMTTASCVLSETRNENLSKQKLETIFAEYLGTKKTLWLSGDILGDDTDGHIDQLARFVDSSKVLVAVEQDKAAQNFQSLQENYRQLQQMTDQHGKPLEIIPLPLPSPKYFQQQQLPCSYCNFYVANSLVLVPTFNDPADQHAIEILTDCFPTRTIVPLNSTDLSWGLGSIHCITQQIV